MSDSRARRVIAATGSLASLAVALLASAGDPVRTERVTGGAGSGGGGAIGGSTGGGAVADGAPATTTKGVLCLRRLPPPIAFGSEWKGSATWDYQDTPEAAARRMALRPRLLVSVDGGAETIVDQKRGGCIDRLALGVAHRVRASRPGVSRQAARFSFDDGAKVLELHYDPFYGNIHVGRPATSAARARAAAAARTDAATSCASCLDGEER